LAAGPSWFFVLVPATPIDTQLLPGVGEADALARRRLEGALARFRAEGAVGDADPLRAITEALRQESFDEVILSTLPAGTSRWLMDDLPTRLAGATRIPVTHVAGEGQFSPESTAVA
jgi:GABA permease